MTTPAFTSQEPQPDPAVSSRLASMGLSSDALQAAILAGHNEAARTTANDVVTRDGYLRWATSLRHLGDVYTPQGFKRLRPGGFEILRSPTDDFNIAVAAGTAGTGTNRMPSTRIERGPLTGQAVEGNRHQMILGANVFPLGRSQAGMSGPVTWLLLHYLDDEANELRVELSVPVEFTRTKGTNNERGAVTSFDPRLILPPVALAETADVEGADDGDDEIEILVERRR